MTELKAPTGAFLLLELDPGLSPQQVAGIFHIATRLVGVAAACDLALVSLELLEERVLLRLSPDDQRAWRRATGKK